MFIFVFTGQSWTDSDGNVINEIAWANGEPSKGRCAVIDYKLNRYLDEE